MLLISHDNVEHSHQYIFDWSVPQKKYAESAVKEIEVTAPKIFVSLNY